MGVANFPEKILSSRKDLKNPESSQLRETGIPDSIENEDNRWKSGTVPGKIILFLDPSPLPLPLAHPVSGENGADEKRPRTRSYCKNLGNFLTGRPNRCRWNVYTCMGDQRDGSNGQNDGGDGK